MELLYDIKKSGVLIESKREKFLEQITTNGDAFNRFYNSQTDLFKKACAFIVGRFSNQEIQEIFRLLPKNLFTAENLITSLQFNRQLISTSASKVRQN